jgi:hypothetical protein
MSAQNYPYSLAPMRPVWRDRKAQAFGAAILAAMALSLALRWPIRLADMDAVALLVMLPGMLAFVLAFAPRPATLGNRIAKDLVTAWTALAMFSGDLVLMLVAVPGILALAVLLSWTARAAHLWGADPC